MKITDLLLINNMKEIKTEDAIGSVLCHDITEIVKDQRKGPHFKKGHIIQEEDIPVLRSALSEYTLSGRLYALGVR